MELPDRGEEPVVGHQRRQDDGKDAGAAAGDQRHQQHRRVESDEGRQRADSLHQPPAQGRGNAHRDRRHGIPPRQ